MSLRLGPTTPWVRSALRNDAEQAMACEALRRTTTLEGTLLLAGSSARGPWQAIIHTADSPSNGYRALGTTLLTAIEKALKEAAVTA